MDNLEISSNTTICFASEILAAQNKDIFPDGTEKLESYLTIDALDPSDDSIGISFQLVPIHEDGQELDGSRRFFLGDYSREQVKEIFQKAVACL